MATAPAGYKVFAAGAVLTATADVQNYLMDQVCGVYDDASDRSSEISSPAEGQLSYLKDDDTLYTYSGAAWVAVGGSGDPENENLIVGLEAFL